MHLLSFLSELFSVRFRDGRHLGQLLLDRRSPLKEAGQHLQQVKHLIRSELWGGLFMLTLLVW